MASLSWKMLPRTGAEVIFGSARQLGLLPESVTARRSPVTRKRRSGAICGASSTPPTGVARRKPSGVVPTSAAMKR